ncbi:MAG: tetratricopeptide repeat protein [Alphaproteobacteria bacterium]
MGLFTGIASAAIIAFIILTASLVVWVRHRSRTDSRFIVFAANLRHDAKGRQTAHVLNSLKSQLGVATGGMPMTAAPDADIPAPTPSAQTAPQMPVAVKGHSWLWQQFAHALIWGEVAPDNKTLRLRFATSCGACQQPLVQELELPANFGAEHGLMLATATALAISPSSSESRQRLAEVLTSVINRLRALTESPPAIFSATVQHQLWRLYADAECYLDSIAPDTARLKSAISCLYHVLENWPYEYAPLDWSATQARLGDALLRIGEREDDTGTFLEAANSYYEALRVLTRSSGSLEWAAVKNSLGLALWRIGEREGSSERIEEAVAAFREALQERNASHHYSLWLQTQNNLGNALCLLGELENSTDHLHTSVSAFKEALDLTTREETSADWAMTQHNLGVALTKLGAREKRPELLEEAVSAFHLALEERTQQQTPMEWAETQNNLGAAFAALGEVTNNIETLKQAVSAYNAALNVYENAYEHAALKWADVQNNLGNALALLGQRETNTQHLEAAVAAFRAALQEYARPRTPLRWTTTQLGLGATFPSLGANEKRSLKPQKTMDPLKKWARERAPLYRAAAQNNLGAALITLGERLADTDKEAACRTMTAAREVIHGALEVRQQAGGIEAIRETQQHLAEIEAVAARLCC